MKYELFFFILIYCIDGENINTNDDEIMKIREIIESASFLTHA